MQRWRWIMLIWTCSAAWAAGQTPPAPKASPPPAHIPAARWTTLQAVDAKASKIKDLRADFIQEKHTLLLKKPLVSKGTLVQIGPRLLMETTHPKPSTVAMDAKQVQMYYPQDRIVEIYPMAGAAGRLAGWPMMRPVQMAQQFDMAEVPVDDPKLWSLRMTPRQKKMAQRLKQIDLVLDPQRGLLQRVTIHDADGDRTVMSLHNIQTNQNLKPASVTLKLPKDVKIVRPTESKK